MPRPHDTTGDDDDMSMMRAAVYGRVGPAHEVLKIAELPRPEPGAGEVRVRLHASGINPADVKRRAGWRGRTTLETPIVPQGDGAGVIDAVGPGVDPALEGTRVWIWSIPSDTFMRDGMEMGTAAEWAVLPAANAVPLPDGVSFEVGAALGVPAITAHYALLCDGPVSGLTVLVQGGAGAVGAAALAMAKAAGARTIATVSSAAKAEVAREAGADHTVNRREGDTAEAIAALAPEGVDRIVEVDFGANATLDSKVLRMGGTIASYSSPSAPEPVMPYYPLQMRLATIRLISCYFLSEAARSAATADINAHLESGALNPLVAATYDLDDIAEAHAAVERGDLVGKVVVRP